MGAEHLTEEEIFTSALEKETPAERSAYLDQVCGDDEELLLSVEHLLKLHEGAKDFLESPPVHGAGSTEADVPSEAPGTVIGRYKLLELIGEGGFGDVYMAEQTEPLCRRVALKVIKLGMDTRAVIARFEAERQALALMDHPNIAKVHDAGATEAGRPYFVMELVRGIPITGHCDENNLTTGKRLGLFIDVCRAVQHAHQKGIIHRDIKPTNVMVTQQDGKPVPKIIDFGVAKATQQRLTEKTLFTEHHQLVGTPEYMSPEQATFCEADVDTRSDIYSLGVLLYELLVGTTPFDTDVLRNRGYDEICRIIRESDPPAPSKRLSALGDAMTGISHCRHVEPAGLEKLLRGDLDWIAMKALDKDRTRRYETALGLALDIERHLSDEPVRARPPSIGYRLQKNVRKHRVLVAASVAVAASLMLGLFVATIGFARASGERQIALRAKEKAVRERTEAQQQRDRAMAMVQFARWEVEDLLHQATDYKIYVDDDSREELALWSTSLLDWDGASESGSDDGQVGSIFIWLRGDRPEVIGAIFRAEYHLDLVTWHELHSLALNPLVADFCGVRVWAPARAGIDLKPVPGADPPAETMQSRLSQMRDLAGQFTARKHAERAWSALALRPEPLYRYGSSDTEPVDGALFAFLDFTDPELVLLIEARGRGSAARWHYALARLTFRPLEVHFRGERVWDDPMPETLGWVSILKMKEYQSQPFIDYAPAAIPQIQMVENLRELAIAYGKYSVALRQAGMLDASHEATAEAEKLWKRLGSHVGHASSRRLHLEWMYSDNAKRHFLNTEDYRNGGRIHEARVAASEAATWYEQLTHSFPDDFRFQQELGYVYADLGRWNQAADAYAKAAQLDPDVVASCRRSSRAALIHVRAGNLGDYRRTCAELLQRHHDTKDPAIAFHVVDACLWLPQAVDDYSQVVRVAEVAAHEGIGRSDHEAELAMADYRSGRFREALDRLDRQLPGWKDGGDESWYPLAWLISSMAHHQLGDDQRAEKELEKAVQWFNETRLHRYGELSARIDRLPWHERLKLNMLRREAEKLVDRPNEDGRRK